MNYFDIIHSHIDPKSEAYGFYITHVILVTKKALEIAKSHALSDAQMKFIEEAAMLHDIGIIKVSAPDIGCHGTKPYICHGTEGRMILESEGLPHHALVAERHTGVGISKEEIALRPDLPLPERDMIPVTIEEKIICWADLFYSKSPASLWNEKTFEEAKKSVTKFGGHNERLFNELQNALLDS